MFSAEAQNVQVASPETPACMLGHDVTSRVTSAAGLCAGTDSPQAKMIPSQ